MNSTELTPEDIAIENITGQLALDLIYAPTVTISKTELIRILRQMYRTGAANKEHEMIKLIQKKFYI